MTYRTVGDVMNGCKYPFPIERPHGVIVLRLFVHSSVDKVMMDFI